MTKKYKVNKAWRVNTRASKTGIKWEYAGKKSLEECEELKTYYNNPLYRGNMAGLKITDVETNEVIYEIIY